MVRKLSQRNLVKVDETIRRVENFGIRPPPGRDPTTAFFGSPGTDFGTPIVPKTTIPAATRVVGPGSDTFTPGVGTAYLFKVGPGGDITPWLDHDGTVISKPIYNYSDVEYVPNTPETSSMTSMAGTAYTTMVGAAFNTMATIVSTDYIGPDTAVPIATMDRAGKLNIPPASTPPQQLRLQRAIIAQPDGIGPDEVGQISIFVDLQVDSTATAGGADTITLAALSGAQAGDVVRIVIGSGTGQSRWIKSLAGNVATIGAFGDVDHPWDATRQPDNTSRYKLERLVIRVGHLNHAEGSGRVLFQNEECYVQPIQSFAGHYTIIRGADKTVLRAVVDESGGISSGQSGEIILSDSSQRTTGLWDFAHADHRIDRFGHIYVVYEKTLPVGGPSIDEGRLYRIVGADCSALTSESSGS